MTLEEELQFLRSKVAALEIKLIENDKTDLAVVFSLPPVLEKLFRMLLQHPRVASETLAERLNINGEAKTAVFRLRKYLSQYNVDIKSRRHFGYWIEPEDKKRLLEVMKVTQASNH
jgi:hypothetical protein